MALPEAVHDKVEKQTDGAEEDCRGIGVQHEDNEAQRAKYHTVGDRLPAFKVPGNKRPLACSRHFAVNAAVDVVVKHAATADNQRHARQKRDESPEIKMPNIDSGQQKTGNTTQVIAVNDAWFGELVVTT